MAGKQVKVVLKENGFVRSFIVELGSTATIDSLKGFFISVVQVDESMAREEMREPEFVVSSNSLKRMSMVRKPLLADTAGKEQDKNKI